MEKECEEQAEDLRNTPIEEVISGTKCTSAGGHMGRLQHNDTNPVPISDGILFCVHGSKPKTEHHQQRRGRDVQVVAK